jgi:hypothetical protein
VVYSGIQDPFTAEFEIALAIFHLRREAESALCVEYVSFTHKPDDETEIGAYWDVLCARKHLGSV